MWGSNELHLHDEGHGKGKRNRDVPMDGYGCRQFAVCKRGSVADISLVANQRTNVVISHKLAMDGSS
jgi:hypothetical protein